MIGRRNRFGDDDHADAEAGGDRQFPDGLNLDLENRQKADRVGDQRHAAGHEQLPEGTAGRVEAVVAAGEHRGAEGAHHLHAMAHADGENQNGTRMESGSMP